MPICFEDLPKKQKTAIMSLRDKTTYLWKELYFLNQRNDNHISCDIRSKTLRRIKNKLKLLEKAGYFTFRCEDVFPLYGGKTRTLRISDITEDFKAIISTMPKSTDQKEEDEVNESDTTMFANNLREFLSRVR